MIEDVSEDGYQDPRIRYKVEAPGVEHGGERFKYILATTRPVSVGWNGVDYVCFFYCCEGMAKMGEDMVTARIRLATNIDWDTDGKEVDLPDTVKLPDDVEDDEIADWLSYQYGWCVNGCEIEVVA